MSEPRPPLQVGQRCRLTPNGPVLTVRRVNVCAAYVGHQTRRTITVTDRKTGEPRTFEATSEELLAISPYAFVYPAGPEMEAVVEVVEGPPHA